MRFDIASEFNQIMSYWQRGMFPTQSQFNEAFMTKEHLDQMGISVAPNGSLIVRYINGEGQKVTLDLTAIIEEKAAEAVKSHECKLHGHQI